MGKHVRRHTWRALAAAVVAFGAWHAWKPLPRGLARADAWHALDEAQLRLLVDRTWTDAAGRRRAEHTIFDAQLAAIRRAHHTVVLDAFLFNRLGGALPPPEVGGRQLSRELTEALLAWRVEHPDGFAAVITDPINSTYGAAAAAHLTALRSAGVHVVETDLDRLRDSNPLYSTPWRLLVRWWEGVGTVPGWLPHPLGTEGERVPLRPWLRLLNFKANHRKVLVCDDGAAGWTALIASANPHDASSAHSNVALQVDGPFALDVLAGEAAVAEFSGAGLSGPGLAGTEHSEVGTQWRSARGPSAPTPSAGQLRARYVTESKIERAALAALTQAGPGDEVGLAMFYLSDRDIIGALLAAAERGATVRVVLDPNRDAFGRTKDGVPNRQVAEELRARSRGKVEVRWYATDGEQFHTKLLFVRREDELWATLGSANFTRRNLDDLNLEANVELRGPRDAALSQQLRREFEWLWAGDGAGWAPTRPFDEFSDRSRLRRLRYLVMERTGLSTF